jgi:hypothetical protein
LQLPTKRWLHGGLSAAGGLATEGHARQFSLLPPLRNPDHVFSEEWPLMQCSVIPIHWERLDVDGISPLFTSSIRDGLTFLLHALMASQAEKWSLGLRKTDRAFPLIGYRAAIWCFRGQFCCYFIGFVLGSKLTGWHCRRRILRFFL